MAEVRQLPGIGPFYSALVVVRACGLTDALALEPKAMAAAGRLYGLGHPATEEEFRQRLDAAGLTRAKATSPDNLATLVLQALHELPAPGVAASAELRREPVFAVPALEARSVPRPALADRVVEFLLGDQAAGVWVPVTRPQR